MMPALADALVVFLSHLFGPKGHDYYFKWADYMNTEFIVRDGIDLVVEDDSPGGKVKLVEFYRKYDLAYIGFRVFVTKRTIRIHSVEKGSRPDEALDEMILLLWLNEQNKNLATGSYPDPEVDFESFDDRLNRLLAV